MAVAWSIGNILVTSDELNEKVELGEITGFREKAQNDTNATLDFLSGTVLAREVIGDNESTGIDTKVPGFKPIGIGKPMSIEVVTIYTGVAPDRGPFGGKRLDLLAVSAVKSEETYNAAPRAINLMRSGVADKEYIEFGALDEGSPIVYYSPSAVNSTTLCSFELDWDTFSDDTIKLISSLFQVAGGLPIFAAIPSAPLLLMVGGAVTNAVGNLGKALWESLPFLRDDIAIRFDTPAMPEALASHLIICNDSFRKSLSAYEIRLVDLGPGRHRLMLVDKSNNKPYSGQEPYIILSLDGKPKANLGNYTPTLASAAILERFYQRKDTAGAVVEGLQSAMELYNDFQFYRKAEVIKNQINQLDKSSPSYQEDLKELEQLFNAHKNNIRNEKFKTIQ